VLSVPGIYLLVAELFGDPPRFSVAFLLATSFRHINFSRIGFRAIFTPLLLVYSVYLLTKAFKAASSKIAYIYCVLAGVVYSLGFYTYIIYRVTPLLFFIFVPFFKDHPDFWKRACVFLITAFIIAFPIGLFFLKNPAFFERIEEVSITMKTSVRPFADLPKETLPALHAVSDGGLARTPPMGWNSWNHFRASIDDKTVREIADAMVSTGMKDAGYVYINIDDTWQGTRDSSGDIQPNSRFPDMKALADYVHSKDLKLGIYSSPGPQTCADYEGSYLHETQDAKTWASWGIDYVKYDWCSASVIFEPEDMQAVYQQMGDALRAAGRPIVYSLSQYGEQQVQTWGPEVGGNLWRTTGDIHDNWPSMSRLGFDRQIGLEKYAGPGHWNDPDMLEIGNGGMSDLEDRTHMSLWSLLAAPLLAGNDLRTMSAATRDTLTNADVIAIDQDKAGRQGYRLTKDGDKEVWAKPLADRDWAVGLFNRGNSEASIAVNWQDLKLSGKHKVRDQWLHKDLGSVGDGFSAEVPSHGVILIRIAR
jgi:alpha-galactosidase